MKALLRNQTVRSILSYFSWSCSFSDSEKVRNCKGQNAGEWMMSWMSWSCINTWWWFSTTMQHIMPRSILASWMWTALLEERGQVHSHPQTIRMFYCIISWLVANWNLRWLSNFLWSYLFRFTSLWKALRKSTNLYGKSFKKRSKN